MTLVEVKMSAAVGLRWKLLATLKLIFRKFNVSFAKSPFLPSRSWIWSLYDWQQQPTSQLESLDSHWSFFSHQDKKHIQSHQWPRGTHYLMFPNDANETCRVHSAFQRLSRWPWWLELIKTDCKAPLFSNVCRYLPCETKQRQREWREWLLFVSLSARATDGRWEIKCVAHF